MGSSDGPLLLLEDSLPDHSPLHVGLPSPSSDKTLTTDREFNNLPKAHFTLFSELPLSTMASPVTEKQTQSPDQWVGKASSFPCVPCRRYYIDQQALQQHLEKSAIHASDRLRAAADGKQKLSGFICKPCGRAFGDAIAFDMHTTNASVHSKGQKPPPPPGNKHPTVPEPKRGAAAPSFSARGARATRASSSQVAPARSRINRGRNPVIVWDSKSRGVANPTSAPSPFVNSWVDEQAEGATVWGAQPSHIGYRCGHCGQTCGSQQSVEEHEVLVHGMTSNKTSEQAANVSLPKIAAPPKLQQTSTMPELISFAGSEAGSEKRGQNGDENIALSVNTITPTSAASPPTLATTSSASRKHVTSSGTHRGRSCDGTSSTDRSFSRTTMSNSNSHDSTSEQSVLSCAAETCWSSCRSAFSSTAAAVMHLELGGCKTSPITQSELYQAAANSNVCHNVIDGRYLRDLTLGKDLIKRYKGNAYPFVCPAEDCGAVFQKLHSLFKHVDDKKCQSVDEQGTATMAELREALVEQCRNP